MDKLPLAISRGGAAVSALSPGLSLCNFAFIVFCFGDYSDVPLDAWEVIVTTNGIWGVIGGCFVRLSIFAKKKNTSLWGVGCKE